MFYKEICFNIYQERETGDHPDRHCPAHEKVWGSEVVEIPEEEGLDESPECSGEHDQGQEDHHFGVPDHADDVVEDSLAWKKSI